MVNSINQGVLVVEAYANNEREVGKAIQEAVSKAIKKLNTEGKRVINITAGSSVKYVLGVNHLTYILWESGSQYVGNSFPQPDKAHQTDPTHQAPESPNSLYNVVLTNYGEKISVIKKVIDITDLSFAEAKAKVDSIPAIIKNRVSKNEAEMIKKQLEAVGATVELVY